MIDICILDHNAGEVVFVKADENEIAEKYENNVELYIRDFLHLSGQKQSHVG